MNHHLGNVLVALLLLLLAGDALAARWMLTRSGALLPGTAGPKSQAFCQANPDVVLVFVDTLTLTPSNRVLESVGPVGLQANINVEAVCISGPVTLRLRYGAQPGSSASAGTDYLPFQLQAGSPPVPVFAPVTAFSASTSIVIIDDDVEEPEEELRIGLLGGEALTPLQVIDIAGSGTQFAGHERGEMFFVPRAGRLGISTGARARGSLLQPRYCNAGCPPFAIVRAGGVNLSADSSNAFPAPGRSA